MNQIDQALYFLMIDSSDHRTGKTGLSPGSTLTVTLSKNGAGFGAPAGVVGEVGSGWYAVDGHGTDANTLGPLALHATGTGADPTDDVFMVVGYNPLDSVRMGLTALPNLAAGSNGGLPIGDNSGRVNLGKVLDNAVPAVSGAVNGVLPVDVRYILGIPANPSEATVDANMVSMNGNTVSVQALVDILTGVVGRTLTAALTGAITGNITGNLSGSIGSVTGNVGGNVVGSVASVVGAVGSVTGSVGSVSGAVGSVAGNVGGNVVGSVASVVGAVGSVAGNVGGNVVGSVASVAGSVGSVTGNVGGNVIGSVDSVVNPVTVGTNNDKTGYALTQAFPTNFASLGINASGHVARVTLVDTTTLTSTLTTYTGNTPQTGDAFTRLGAPAGASVSADIAASKTNIDAILADTGTDGVVVASASKTGYALAAAGFDAIVIETGVNARQALSLIAAATAGVASDLNLNAPKFQAVNAPATRRIEATTDQYGNRSVVTVTPPV
ncbi:MAG: hypothetical protein AB7G11_02705 [Phycisphaerales bacterium]